MNSKASYKGKKGSASRRGRLSSLARTVYIFLIVVLPMAIVAGLIYLLAQAAPSAFRVKEVELSGNEHLTDAEVMQIGGLKGKENLLALSNRKVYEHLKESPWIMAAAVRKEYPSKLLIRITETEPFALLDMKGKTFVVDDRGRMLEQLKENSVPFLPVILSDPYKEKEAFLEGVDLAKAMKTMGMLHRSQRIEIIAHKPQEIAANFDGVFVKIGAGEHEDKLARLLEIEEEIRKRNIPVSHIDLRFAKKVIVKPVNEVIK